MLFNRPEGYTEQELLEEVAGGNESAFNLLYDKYAGKVYAMGMKYLKSPFLAQDAVQEIFVKVWNNSAQLPYLKSFPAWLTTVSRNQLINELQKEIPMEPLEAFHAEEPSSAERSTGTDIDFRELEQLIKKGVDSLSPRQQQIYKLSREEGLSHKQIADQLHISYDVVREHMSKALKNLRSFLEHNYHYMLLLWLFSRNN
ncbi:RNA polymerase sigma factor [Pedobacter caeni]|uniref:RNA polymerase sigma-70 factor, ECF subfamily n=1 Tax=Pedobacter caeni TaxID=288992 RepID=A0A1M4VR16_9SPHI|nr:RNA polymerase sigma-70 factor [Pedobacter caeni]SHE71368.1 RNA polymerase sigma-70 factor, ECF subfamily [Pedobacter caeni]